MPVCVASAVVPARQNKQPEDRQAQPGSLFFLCEDRPELPGCVVDNIIPESFQRHVTLSFVVGCAFMLGRGPIL